MSSLYPDYTYYNKEYNYKGLVANGEPFTRESTLLDLDHLLYSGEKNKLIVITQTSYKKYYDSCGLFVILYTLLILEISKQKNNPAIMSILNDSRQFDNYFDKMIIIIKEFVNTARDKETREMAFIMIENLNKTDRYRERRPEMNQVVLFSDNDGKTLFHKEINISGLKLNMDLLYTNCINVQDYWNFLYQDAPDYKILCRFDTHKNNIMRQFYESQNITIAFYVSISLNSLEVEQPDHHDNNGIGHWCAFYVSKDNKEKKYYFIDSNYKRTIMHDKFLNFIKKITSYKNYDEYINVFNNCLKNCDENYNGNITSDGSTLLKQLYLNPYNENSLNKIIYLFNCTNNFFLENIYINTLKLQLQKIKKEQLYFYTSRYIVELYLLYNYIVLNIHDIEIQECIISKLEKIGNIIEEKYRYYNGDILYLNFLDIFKKNKQFFADDIKNIDINDKYNKYQDKKFNDTNLEYKNDEIQLKINEYENRISKNCTRCNRILVYKTVKEVRLSTCPVCKPILFYFEQKEEIPPYWVCKCGRINRKNHCIGCGKPQFDSWSCSACTFENSGDKKKCEICNASKPKPNWSCKTCTFENSGDRNQCEVCQQHRKKYLKYKNKYLKLLNKIKNNN